MDDAFRVSFPKRVRDLARDLERLADIDRSARDSSRESFSFDVLHHDEAAALIFDDFVDRADVRVIQPRRRPGLAHQPLGAIGEEQAD